MVSWLTRSEEPANENSTELPGLSVWNCWPISVKGFLSEAAAKTRIFPWAAALGDAPEDLGGDDVWPGEPQPLIPASVRTAAKASPMGRVIFVLREFR